MSDLTSRSESYMNDLIRRGDVLALFPMNDCSDKMIGLYERVLDIPTAYDSEEVLAELDASSVSATIVMGSHKINRKVINADRAISIVKAGGIDG